MKLEKIEIVVLVLMSFVFILAIAMIADRLYTESYPLSGIVIGKQYITSEYNKLTNEYRQERYILIIKIDNKISSVDVTANIYYSAGIEEKIEIPCMKGKMFGTIYCTE